MQNKILKAREERYKLATSFDKIVIIIKNITNDALPYTEKFEKSLSQALDQIKDISLLFTDMFIFYKVFIITCKCATIIAILTAIGITPDFSLDK